jgi:hypothetical protein
MISTFCSVLVIAVLKGTFLKLFVSGEDPGSKTRESKNGQIEKNSSPNEFIAFKL